MASSKEIYKQLRARIFDVIDAEALASMTTVQLQEQLGQAVDLLITQQRLPIPRLVRNEFVTNLRDELVGLGPIQPLMDDESISDVMVNGPEHVFFERNGVVEHSDITFVDEQQVLEIAKRIAARVGRRVDESVPMCDARLPDGSRVNIVAPPIAIDGTSISIRKFKKQKLGLEDLASNGSMSQQMAQLLAIAARCRLNVVISGGTGSGKTTLLNALSQYISTKERIVTIEDAAELQLQQPHVVRLETRTAGIEGSGAIGQRQLVINSLRMRPDRVIVGECRGSEAFEMLQAMNTGHDGSMTTLHANSPRDAVSRIESMVMMATSSLPLEAIRRTIVSAVDVIIQISRLHDGSRRITSISEVVGLEGNSVVLEEIFKFQPDAVQQAEGKVSGHYVTSGLMQRSVLVEKAQFFGLQHELNSIFGRG